MFEDELMFIFSNLAKCLKGPCTSPPFLEMTGETISGSVDIKAAVDGVRFGNITICKQLTRKRVK